MAYNSGKYDEAYARWLPLANAGDATAEHNMGVLWSQGLSSQTPRNLDRAAEYFALAARQGLVESMAPLAEYQLSKNQPETALGWLNLAARWNDPQAIAMLQRMGAPVPAADLAMARQQAQAQSDATMGYALGCALAGGCGVRPQLPPPQKVRPFDCRPTGTYWGKTDYHCD